MHHQRRKSGNVSTTDLHKLTTTTSSDSTKQKQSSMTRRPTITIQYKHRRHREKDNDKPEGPSFPPYCMMCDMRFTPPSDGVHLWCSESCRLKDSNTSRTDIASRGFAAIASASMATYAAPYHVRHINQEPRDIVPRARPSRPGSMHIQTSPPVSPGAKYEFERTESPNSALRRLCQRPPSPPTPTRPSDAFSQDTWSSGRGAVATPSSSSCGSSGRSGFSYFPSAQEDMHTHVPMHWQSQSQSHSHGSYERPLPSRYPGGSSRSRSVELVTPIIPI